MESGQIKGLKNILYFQFMVRLHKYSTQQRTPGEREKSGGAHTQNNTLHTGIPLKEFHARSQQPPGSPGCHCLPEGLTAGWVRPGRISPTILVAAWVAQAGAQRTKSGKLWFSKQGAKTASSLTARKSNEL